MSLKLRLVDLKYNFECDWLIQTKTLNVTGLLNCPTTISERFRQFCFFTKRSTLLIEKSRKINFLHLFFIEHAKFVNASRLGEKLKKGVF